MPKIKKLKRSKKFRVNVNRKRLRNKLSKLPNIECPQIKEAWEAKRSIVKNLEEMGLAYDPNRVLKIPNVKNDMLKFVKENGEEEESDAENVEVQAVPKKIHVQKSLEEESKQPRVRSFRLPNNEVQFATYMMDKYGDDYKTMVRDRKNFYQLTWRQIKAKIERFKNVPEQYAEYLVKKGEIVLEDPTPLKKIKPPPAEVPEAKKNTDSKSKSRRKRKKPGLLESVWKEESIVEEDDCIIDENKTLSDDNENKKSVSNGEKKLQLFSDDEGEDKEEDDEDDSNIDDDDEIEDESDKVKNNKTKTVKSLKSKVPVQKNKKLKVR